MGWREILCWGWVVRMVGLLYCWIVELLYCWIVELFDYDAIMQWFIKKENHLGTKEHKEALRVSQQVILLIYTEKNFRSLCSLGSFLKSNLRFLLSAVSKVFDSLSRSIINCETEFAQFARLFPVNTFKSITTLLHQIINWC